MKGRDDLVIVLRRRGLELSDSSVLLRFGLKGAAVGKSGKGRDILSLLLESSS